MKIYASIDGDGFVRAFYNEAIHGQKQHVLYDEEGVETGSQPNPDCKIPRDAVAITDEQWHELLENPGLRKLIDGAVVVYDPPPADPIYPALSSRQFWLAASRINTSKTDVLALLDAMDDHDAAADLRIEVTETVSFERTNPAVDQLAGLLDITPEQLDALWIWAAEF